MEATKTFERNGVRYRPGDALPDDLDAATKAHYLGHGMARECRTPAPSETQPAGPARRPRTPGPKQTQTPGPTQTTQALPGDAQGAAGEGGAQAHLGKPDGAPTDAPASDGAQQTGPDGSGGLSTDTAT